MFLRRVTTTPCARSDASMRAGRVLAVGTTTRRSCGQLRFRCFAGRATSKVQRGELPLVGCALGEPTGGGAGAGRGGAASYHTTPLGNITQQSESAARITRSGKAPGEPNVGGGAGPWHTGASAAPQPAGTVAVVLPWASWPCAMHRAVGCERQQPVCGPAPAICHSAWRSCAAASRVPDLP